MKPRRPSAALLVVAAAFILPTWASAQSFTWDGGGTDDNFGTAANWNPDGTPSVGSGVNLLFTGSTRTTPVNNYTSGDDFNEWRLLSSTNNNFTITGNSFGLYGKIENDTGSGGTFTVNTASIVARDSSIEINPVGGNINIGAAVELDGNANLNVYDGSFGNTLTINGVLSNGNGSGGNGSLILNQTSTVILTADGNDYGATTINASTKLQVGNGGATGSLGSGAITNNGQLIFHRTADLSVSNTISGSGTLTKQGSNILTLSGSNSYSGITTVNGGTLSIGAENNLGSTPGSYVANQLTLNSSTLRATGGGFSISNNRGVTISGGVTLDNSSMGNGANFNLNSKITGTGTLTLKANGDTSDSGGGVGGNLTLGNSSNDFTGNVIIQSGVVNFASDAAFGNAANTITIQGGGLVCTAATNSLAASRSIIFSGGGDKIFRAYGSSTFTVNGPISGSGSVRHTDGGTLVLNGANTFTGNIDNVRGNLTLGNSGHVGNVSMFTGTLALNAGNTFSGYVHMRGSNTVRLDADHALPDTATVLLWGGTTFNVNGKTDTMGSLTTGSSGDINVIVNLGSGANLTVTNNNLPPGQTSGYGKATVHGRITGTGNITYAHATTNNATWDWYNTTNDFTGTVTVTHGRLRVVSDAALGNPANDLVFNGDVVNTFGAQDGKASIQVANGANLTLEAGRDIILNSGKEGTMYVWGATTMTVNSKVTGGGSLRKEDGGVLLLNNAANDWGGKTTVIAGELRLGATGSLPATTDLTVAGGTFNMNGIAASVNSLSGGGQTGGIVSGNTTLTVTGGGNYEYTGRVTDTNGGATVKYTGSGSLTLSGSADNSGGRAAVDSGTLILAKASTASVHAVGTNNIPALTINGGIARLAGTGGDQIYTDSNVHMTGGTFDLNARSEGFRGLTGTAGSITNTGASPSVLTVGENSLVGNVYTFDGAITDGTSSVGLTKNGSGTQILNGTSTYTGATVINGGSLLVNGALGNTAVSINGGTLGGAGTIAGTTTIQSGGTLAPGNSIDTIDFTGSLTLLGIASFEIDAASVTSDLANVGGLLTFGGTLNVSNLSGTFAQGQSYNLFDFTSATGTFSSVNLPSLDPSLGWDTTQLYTSGLITVVPESSAAALLAAATIGLALRRRR